MRINHFLLRNIDDEPRLVKCVESDPDSRGKRTIEATEEGSGRLVGSVAFYIEDDGRTVRVEDLTNKSRSGGFENHIHGVGTALMDCIESQYRVVLSSTSNAVSFYTHRHMEKIPDSIDDYQSTPDSQEKSQVRLKEQVEKVKAYVADLES